MTELDKKAKDWNEYIQRRHNGQAILTKLNFTTWISKFENLHDFIFENQLYQKAEKWFDHHLYFLYKNKESKELYETFYFVFCCEGNIFIEVNVTKNINTREYLIDVYFQKDDYSGWLTGISKKDHPELSKLAETLVVAVVEVLKTKMIKERLDLLVTYKITYS